jgi:outer membrane lipopolysaccharide assembly protein LptE/RlpB
MASVSSPASLLSCCDWHYQESIDVAYVSWTAAEMQLAVSSTYAFTEVSGFTASAV